ncbi:MAG: hypothetical protein KF824_03185 [Fimbriimonadaceae bacterium]|nr:hypothetical protein [Fimbriimonadaceae bacterium]QYK53903.1 MAG: hypothetical protein KF824_03185 [Fimbriimonadaceae bacterium]
MITCNLNKPETTFDTIRKTYKDLKPTDAALIATALVEAGRFADAVYDDKAYAWVPETYDEFTRSVAREVTQVQETVEDTKKAKLKAQEEEAVTLTVKLKPSMAAGEKILGDRKDLKTLIGDILGEGVEYLFANTDIGWHWTLERVNWATLSGGELKRHIKFKADFVEPHVGLELGPGGKRKKR